MADVLLSCTVCNCFFQSRAALNNHVKRDHQSSVKVKFRNGKVAEIKRDADNMFNCSCGKIFKHPVSLHKHTKECNGELRSIDDESTNRDISSEETDSDGSELSESDDINCMDETPVDCIGTMSQRFH